MLSTDLSERQLLDALPVSIYALDLDGHLTVCTRRRPGSPTADRSPHRSATAAGAACHLGRDSGTMSRDQIEHGMQQLRGPSAGRTLGLEQSAPNDNRVSLARTAPLHDEAHAVTGYVVSTVITSLDRDLEADVDSAVTLAPDR
jgi:hypothetical protein